MSILLTVLLCAGMALGGIILLIDYRDYRRWRREAEEEKKRQEAEAEDDGQKRPPTTEVLAPYVLTEDRAQFACGHEYATKFGHDFYGVRREVREEFVAKREMCGDCMLTEIKPLLIRCCVCGSAIWPGDPVAAYGNDGSFKKEWSTTLHDGKAVIGCMSWDCCPSGGFFAGHWSSKGFRPAFGEHLSLAAQVIATGKPVSVSVEDGQATVTVEEVDKDDDDGKGRP